MFPMKLSVILILVTALSLLGCDGDNTLSPPELAGSGYFPMQVGNRWTYSLQNNEQYEWSYKIVGTSQIGSSQYFIFEQHFSLSARVDSIFYRVGTAGKIYRNGQGKDVLYIEFNRSKGNKWDSYGEYRGVINKKNFAKTVPAGTFYNCLEVFFDIPMVIDDETWEVYAPGVGLVEFSGQIGSVQLKSAVVNGVSIP